MTVKVHVENPLPMDAKMSESILNSLKDQICMIDPTGIIRFVNHEWSHFAMSNGGTLSNTNIGANYLQQCEQEPALHQGLQDILSGASDGFTFEYPCHSPSEQRWFLMQATPLQGKKDSLEGAVIRHVNITKQKLLELQLMEYAEKDSLTSLFNRRFFQEQLTKETSLALQDGTNLSLLYIDIDNFKEINDTFGHPVGDKVLKEVAQQIAENGRPSDISARLGGDEFAILLPDTDPKELELIANRLSQKIQQLKIHEQNHSIPVTVSIGGKSFKDDFPPNSIIEWADKALYLAKDKGKNQVVIIE
ncbi:MAG TPA: GGDEF domain-containing protein [Planococcus sp. (in: firmicutes)]|nr:GGDEF domain-containing protein [Planococcus sp. (in: firmicutes)]